MKGSSYDAEKEEQQIENHGRREFFALRKEWSGAIMGWVSALVWFNILFTLAVSALVGWRLGGFNF